MKKRLNILTATACALLLMNGCGDSSDNNDEESTTPTITSTGTTSSSSGFIPTLDFDVPDNVSSDALSLTVSEDSKTVIERRAERMERILDRLNKVIERLNSDKVKEQGSFSGKGADGLLSGKLTALASEADYDYEAVLCHDSQLFMSIKWAADGSLINSKRWFGITPMGNRETAEMMTEVNYSVGTSKVLEFYAHGTPWRQPELDMDGDNLTEYTRSEIGADSVFTIKGVQDWYATAPADGVYEGGGYLAGQINLDGTGEFVAYRKAHTVICADGFDETNLSAPGFCLGREVGSASRFDDTQRAAAWERLKAIGIASKDKLRAVAFDSGTTCEVAE